MPNDPRDIDVDEIIPPGGRKSSSAQGDEPLLKLFAHLLDELFKVPGTKIRFGLDPILGLIPGIGDSLAGLISTALLSLSVRQGLPKVVIFRMALNILINAAIGAIPVVGDAFSVWFKSNVRNHQLYLEHRRGPRSATKADWSFVVALIAGVSIVLLGTIFLIGLVVYSAVRLATGAA